MVGLDGPVLLVLALAVLALLLFWLSTFGRRPTFERSDENPILAPDPTRWWESEAVFNPAAVVHDGRVHLFYRALGRDGVSRIGYASSGDGIHFERSRQPAYEAGAAAASAARRHYGPLSYNQLRYASGGGWGGAEDPRAVILDDLLFMNFSMFEGWNSIRMTLTLLGLGDLSAQRWLWEPPLAISPPGETQKNWLFFPERIGGRIAVLHGITPKIMVDYVDSVDEFRQGRHIKSVPSHYGWGYLDESRKDFWDYRLKGASSPPIKTSGGWLLLYHAIHDNKYKVGAMLLDLEDPTRVLYRSAEPVFEPAAWYENDWKPGVVYASGAVVFGDDLMLYYGGGDKYVAAARANLHDFVRALTRHEHAVFTPVKI